MGILRKNKRENNETAISGVFNQKKVNQGDKVTNETLEEVVKTTDSISFVAKSYSEATTDNPEELAEAKESILKSYQFATHKINRAFEDVIEAQKHISSQYLAIQVLISNYSNSKDIDQTLKVVRTFNNEVINCLTEGKGVFFSNELVFEITNYSNRILPSTKIVPSLQSLMDTLSWEEVFNRLVLQGKLSSADLPIVGHLVKAIVTNVANGYYVKIGRLIVTRIRLEAPDTMLLFSRETLEWINNTYQKFMNQKRSRIGIDGVITQTNYVNSFKLNNESRRAEDSALLEEVRSKEKHADRELAKLKREIEKRDKPKSEQDIQEERDKNVFLTTRKTAQVQNVEPVTSNLTLASNNADVSTKESVTTTTITKETNVIRRLVSTKPVDAVDSDASVENKVNEIKDSTNIMNSTSNEVILADSEKFLNDKGEWEEDIKEEGTKWIQPTSDGDKWQISSSKYGKAIRLTNTQKEALAITGTYKNTNKVWIKRSSGWQEATGWDQSVIDITKSETTKKEEKENK